jgi:rifampicin phosphotransferase
MAHDLRAVVAARRLVWEQQRRLSPPLTLGNPLGARVIARATNAMRVPGVDAESAPGASQERPGRDVLIGMPASPGRVTGPVRIVRGSEDFERFQAGEVLVAQVTAPAWTPLFERAAAVITDGGSVAAHASLVAREYGIPAVVGAGDATARLHDGQRVTVDGSAGVVEVEP